ncbi:hypothetical protein GALMADRAFT_61068 [Galerina marginata CBS 339.88]|uniref:Prolyl 4-hydroxylase alpha subunit Fe(2+) 2OG dioxygenase domain-containing protein n=1 Tax=Galerina marginata (strain CBS 339.88) TaxID=685588 RepID=A0A067TFJ2_GALM3|nr:hypothetical protein GALMADRAFT_61068 [Galerina marginata CBS 339.88]
MESFKRIAGFSSCKCLCYSLAFTAPLTFIEQAVMASWAPELYDHYVTTLGKLYKKNPGLKRNFPSSIFTAATYNFGPQTTCYKHTDFANLPFGWCSVTALGSYDPTKGGHLILWDFHLVIEFPPGSTILIPSAIVAHSNTAVSTHETRYSFAQYTAGALFRWVANDHQKAAVYLKSLSEEETREVKVKNKARFQLGLSLFPTLKKAGHEVL